MPWKYILSSTVFFGLTGLALAGSVSVTVPVQIQPPPPPLTIAANPASATVNCGQASAQPGALVSSISTSGGDGNTISYTCTGDCVVPGGSSADFTLSSTTSPTTVVVGPSGMVNCPAPGASPVTKNVTVTANQP